MSRQNKQKKMSRKEKKEAKKFASSIEDRRASIGHNMSFAASEAYKLLRTNLVFTMTDENKCKVIGVTSAMRGEGKSTTSMNLAITLADGGKRVLLIEADMRLPIVATTLQIDEAPGLSNVLAGVSTLNESVQHFRDVPRLSILPAGEIPPNPNELLSSRRMDGVLNALVPAFDYIILDLPPINAVSDGLAVSNLLSGMLVVVRQDYCEQGALAEAMRRMELLQVKVLGFVMNGAEGHDKSYKKYGHKYGYGYGYYGQTNVAKMSPQYSDHRPPDVAEDAQR